MSINRNNLALCSLVGRNLTINGDMWVDDFGLRIDGHVVGNVNAEHGLVMVGAGGSVMGSIRAARIIVAGKVVGNLIASDIVECSATAQVQGHAHSAGLLIHAGAIVRGTMAAIDAKPSIALAQASANDDKHEAVRQRAVG
ncbi:polymer-forming cytoskeletal protein [Comamonadaceae bacterium M7527]|nr:polymer-forming cytoskeletal protein [Comamonadaceae bacterium M7527]